MNNEVKRLKKMQEKRVSCTILSRLEEELVAHLSGFVKQTTIGSLMSYWVKSSRHTTTWKVTCDVVVAYFVKTEL